MRRISIGLPWDSRMREEMLVRARLADDAGVDTIWINEGFGHDAFSGMTLLAVETSHARLGTAVVNVYSRTAGALAQHYATLDQLSTGRVVAGLGTSGTGVIERFHGLPYQPAVQRLAETVKLLQAFWRHERITYHGAWYDLDRAIVMGIDPVQSKLPIYLAALHPNSVRLTAEQADGWLPAWIPFERLGVAIVEMRAWSADVGRDPMAVDVRGPGLITVVNDAAEAEKIREDRRQQLAFFVARNGDFYYRQFVRHGLADEAALIRREWNSNGMEAGIAAVPVGLEDHFDFIGPLEACIEKIEMQAELGVDLHQVSVNAKDQAEWGKSIHRLVG